MSSKNRDTTQALQPFTIQTIILLLRQEVTEMYFYIGKTREIQKKSRYLFLFIKITSLKKNEGIIVECIEIHSDNNDIDDNRKKM